MPDKTPLELAKESIRECPVKELDGSCCQCIIAAALIARMTPVEIQLLPGATRGVCQCGDTPEYDARFCEDCGRPIKWTLEISDRAEDSTDAR